MKNKMIVLNTKSNFLANDFINYIESLSNIDTNNNIVLAASYPLIPFIKGVKRASQDVSKYPSGAYTGEVNSNMLKSLGVEYSLVGHFEREKYFNETIEEIKAKINNSINNSIIPIIFVGEEDKNDLNETIDIIMNKLNNILTNIDISKVIICYEPLWAIDGDEIPNIDNINTIVNKIKEKYNTKVLYGGSINKNNIKLLENTILDGYVLGRLSLDINSLKEVL